MSEKIVSDELFPLICEKLLSGGSVRLTVTGNSMYPFFHDREDVAEICLPPFPHKKDEIVFYKRESGAYVLHRIVKAKGEVLYCRGDNQFGIPEKIDAGSVLGAVRSYTSKGKTYTRHSFRSRAVLCYVKVFYCLRRLHRKLSKIINRNTSGTGEK